MTSYFNDFNVFEYGKNILDRLDVSYGRACMATSREEYFTNMLDYLLDDNERHCTPLSSKKLQEVVSRVIEEEESIPNAT